MRRYTGRLRIEARVDDSGASDALRGAAKSIPGALYRATSLSTDIVHLGALQNINKRTGKTALTVKKAVSVPTGSESATGRVWTDDLVAWILERGSKAHVIRPRAERVALARATGSRPPALRFGSGGGWAFAREVYHPGTRAYRWMERTVLGTSRAVINIHEVEIRRALIGRR